jgi:hypothetical protein
MTAHNGVAGNAIHSLVDEPESYDMDDHGQHDQRQAPYPVCAPIHGIVDKEGCENGMGNVHRDLDQSFALAQEKNYPEITMKITRRVHGQTGSIPEMPVKSAYR